MEHTVLSHTLAQWVVILSLLVRVYTTRYLHWIEHRLVRRVQIEDPLLRYFPSVDSSKHVFSCSYTLGVWIAMNHGHWIEGPRGLATLCWVIAMRMGSLYLLPLEPPRGMIDLRDVLVEGITQHTPLKRDLFFSGHLSTVFFMAKLCPPYAWLCYLSAGWIAYCLLFQKCHYTVDMVVAPMAVALAAELAQPTVDLVSRLPAWLFWLTAAGAVKRWWNKKS